MKKAFSCFVCFALIVSILLGFASSALAADMNAQKNEQLTSQTGGTVQSSDQNISFSKTIAATGIENYFDVTLQVVEQEAVNRGSVDVVIVMDISNTMNYDHTGVKPSNANSARLAEAKAAAKTFVDSYLQATNISADRNLGLVTFNSDATIEIGLQTVKANMKNTIDGISAPAGNRRFTNIEGGLLLAQRMLNASDSQYKFVVLVTDGFPTTYTQTESDTQMTGYDTFDANGTIFRDLVANKPVAYGCDYSDEAAIRARTQATAMKNGGVNIISIGVDVGAQTIKGYLDKHQNEAFSTVDRTSTDYEIGSASSTSAYKNWLGNSIGGGKDITSTQSYHDGDNTTKLNTAFSNILSVVQNLTYRPMAQAAVKDPMGANAEFLGFFNKGGTLQNTALNGSRSPNAENTASYTGFASADAIDWNLEKSGFTLAAKTVNGVTVNVYTYTLRYRVRLTNEVMGFNQSASHPANNKATMTYDDPFTSGSDNQKLVVPDPAVKGYLGSLSFTKKGGTISGGDIANLEGAVFQLSHSSSCTVCAEAQNTVAIAARTATSGRDGTVTFNNIPSGHDYVLKETTTPQNYITADEVEVAVAYGETSANIPGNQIVNKRILPTRIEVSGRKFFENGNGNGYQFVLKDAQGNQVGKITASDANGNFSFVLPPIHSVGTYFYEVREVIPEGHLSSGIIYDPSVYHINVAVTAQNNQFVTKTTITNHTTGQVVADGMTDTTVGGMTFTNTTRSSVPVILEAEKTVEGRGMTADFQFDLKDSDGNVVQTKTNDIYGKIVFDPLTFTEKGTYLYSITENGTTQVSEEEPYMVYDDAVYTVTIVVADAPDAASPFKTTVTYQKDNAVHTGSIIFNNKWVDASTAEFSLIKQAWISDTETKPLAGVHFTLTHDAEHGCDKVINPFTVQSTEEGVVTFANIPSGHNYLLMEADEDGNGHLTIDGVTYQTIIPRHVTVSHGNVSIDGTLVTAQEPPVILNVPANQGSTQLILEGIKYLTGRELEAGEFSFALYETDADFAHGILKETVSNGADGAFAFAPLYFDGVGRHYYAVKELNDGQASINYDNAVYCITAEVRDGMVIRTISREDGGAANELIFINSFEPLPPPKTGDDSNIALWLALMSASVAGVVLVSRRRKV